MNLTGKFRNSITVLMALVLVCCFSFGALASDSDLTYFSRSIDTPWTTVTNAGDTVTLQAGPANLGLLFAGFSTKAAAENVSWTVNAGSAMVDSIAQSAVYLSGYNVWVSQAVVETNASGYGPISLRATNTNPGALPSATVDLTIAIEAAIDVSSVEDIAVEVFDVHGDSSVYVWAENLTVDKAANGGSFYNIPDTAQSYPTAATALGSIVDPSKVGTIYEVPDFVKEIKIALSNYTGYVSGIRVFDWLTGTDVVLSEHSGGSSGYVYWHYRIVRDNSIVPESAYISAGAMPLQDGDTVHWIYGNDSETQDYFDLL